MTHDEMGAAHPGDADWALAARYLAGECGPAEARAVEARAAADADFRALLNGAREAWSAGDAAEARWNVDAAFARVQGRIAMPSPSPEPIPLRRLRPVPQRRAASAGWLKAAAAVAVLAGGAAVVREAVDHPAAQPVEMREVATQAGQRARLTLADGTEVELAPGSRLRYPATFPDDGRDVSLEGEGWFHVARDESRPFRVRAAGSVTRVLGTRFALRTSPAGVRLVVEEGRVAFGGADSAAGAPPVLVTGGFAARMDGDGALSAPAPVDAGRALAWRAGRLAFDDTPLPEVAAELERWYGLRIRVALPRADTLRLTADLQGAGAGEALAVVGLALSLDVQSTDSAVVLRRRDD